MDGLFAVGVIGLPPLICWGLTISEAFAGSDVGGMQTYAYKDGDEWVISGTKKYGSRSQMTRPPLMCVRTGGSRTARSRITSPLAARPRAGTPSFSCCAVRGFLPRRSRPRIRCGGYGVRDVRQGPRASVEHAWKGGQGDGRHPQQFNHERWAIIAMSLSTQRLIVEECLKYVAYCSHLKALFPDTMAFSCRWSQQRQAFGKPLSSQAVVRAKLAQMIARVESAQNWLENVTHQMNSVRPSQRRIYPLFEA
jgi:alkylation response protein AidB-like acyl-CoA dehydrogenase